MAVDPKWLEETRAANRAKLGLGGMGLGMSLSEQISAQFEADRRRSDQSEALKAAAEVSKAQVEAQAANAPKKLPISVPLPTQSNLPNYLLGAAGVLALVGIGVVAYKAVKS